MSLIEKALTKTKSSQHSPGATAQPQSPSPQSLVGPPGRTPRIGLMVSLGALLGLALAAGWALLEYWLRSPSQVTVSSSRQELFAGPREDSARTQQASERPGEKDSEQKEQGQEAAPAEPPGTKGEVPGNPLLGWEGSLAGVGSQSKDPRFPGAGPSMPARKDPLSQEAGARPQQKNSEQKAPAIPKTSKGPQAGGKERAASEQKHLLLLEKAYIQAQAGQLSSALQIYDQVLTQDPGQFEALLNRGVLRMRMGDLPGARRDLLEAKQLKPQDSTLLNALGVLYLESGDHEEAARYFLRSPEPSSIVNLALLYWRKGNQHRALELLEEAQARVPQDPWPAYYRGLFLGELGRHKEAREELERAHGLARRRGDMELMRKLEATRGAP